MITYRDLVSGLRSLNIPPNSPVIAHASLSAFGQIYGGAESLLGALASSFAALVMPAYTYKTMLVPEEGPPENAIRYGSDTGANRMAVFFSPTLPVDPSIGRLAEALRRHPEAKRTAHPCLSFCGLRAEPYLAAQTLAEPLAVIGALAQADGWVLLLGVDHTANTSIHWGERQAGRKTFTRWALTARGVVECLNYPACSDGFNAITPYVESFTRTARIGRGKVRALPLPALINAVQVLLAADPYALLCQHPACPRCSAVRKAAGR